QRGAQCAQQLLFRKLIVVRTRLRPVDRATVSPKWRADAAHAGAARALLLPKFLACAADQLLVLGGVRAGATGGAVVLHRLPQQGLVHLTEDFFGEFERAYLLAVQVDYINVIVFRHMLFSSCSR